MATASGSRSGNAICPVTLPEEFSRLWVEALTHCLEILGGNLSFQTQQFSAASVPPAFDRPILVVVVALLEMALCVAFTAGHGTNRQHVPTLALFEIRDQPSRVTNIWHTDDSQVNSKRAALANRQSVVRGCPELRVNALARLIRTGVSARADTRIRTWKRVASKAASTETQQ